jgi:uncharacterized protein
MSTHPAAFPPGTPAWADITVPDVDRARAFYGPLLGWEFEVGGPATGGYVQATLVGRRVAGLAEPMGEDPAPPSAWCVYLATDDVDATTAAVTEAGGTALVGAMPILDMGVMGIYVDPTGAVFGAWQPGTHTGWDAVDEPGSVVWSEVMTHDHAAALAFYRQVYGWGVDDMSGPGFTYATVAVDGQTVAGVGQYGSQVGPDAPSAWTLYFGVDDADDAVARVAELGGTVVSPPSDTPYGRMALVQGPFGEVFALMGPDAGQAAAQG